jgi:16S rRNA (guanine527-N7)-methyltransferase
MGLDLRAGARGAIDDHVRLLLAWNASINLTAVRDPAEIAIRHVADSLAGLTWLDSVKVDRFVDLGSGGGYPAIPLAIARPVHDLVLVESVGKKARFLEAALGVVRERVPEAAPWRTIVGRAEAVARDPNHRGRWPVVTARAVASLANLVELALPLLEPGGTLLAWKSGNPGDDRGLGAEVEAAERAVAAIGGDPILVEAPVSAVDRDGTGILAAIGDHRLVRVGRGRGPLDDRWPRDPAARRREPW